MIEQRIKALDNDVFMNWLGGYIDANSGFGFTRQGKKLRPYFNVSSKDKELLLALYNRVWIGRMSSTSNGRYKWYSGKASDILAILRLIHKHMIVRFDDITKMIDILELMEARTNYDLIERKIKEYYDQTSIYGNTH